MKGRAQHEGQLRWQCHHKLFILAEWFVILDHGLKWTSFRMPYKVSGKRWAPFGESGRAPELKAYFENVQAKPEQTKAERNTLHSKGLCKEAEFVQFK